MSLSGYPLKIGALNPTAQPRKANGEEKTTMMELAFTTKPHYSANPKFQFRRRSRWTPSRIVLPMTRTGIPAMASAALEMAEAAKYTVDNFVKSNMVIGLGSGFVSGITIQYLGKLLQAGELKNIVVIPMSVSSANEAAKAGIPLDNYQDNLQIDFAFYDADVIEEGSLSAVIGRRKQEGGDSILQEKCIIKDAKELVFIVNEKQYIKDFEGSIPVVIKSVNWMETAEEIDDLFLGDAEVWRRSSFGHSDPLGGEFPLVTTEGHHILDVIFTSPVVNLCRVADSLDSIDGVVDHGLITNVSSTTVITSQDGLKIVDNLPLNAAKG